MEKSRKQKILLIFVLMLSIASLSIGFAAFSVSLNITSQANVSPNSDTFSVKFSTEKDNLVVNDVKPSSKTLGLKTSNGLIDNSTNPIIKDLSVTFTEPGQYVEYTFYARNEGEYTAYLNNINFIGNVTCMGESDATDSLVYGICDYINISVKISDVFYNTTTAIEGHALEQNKAEEIVVRVEYDLNGTRVDGGVLIKFPDIALVYSTVDDSSIQPVLPVVRLVSGRLDVIGSEVCIKDECFYIISNDGSKVTMLAKYQLGLDANMIKQTTFSSGKTVTIFADDNQKGENYSDYNGSIVEKYVNSYYSYLEEQGITPIEARLISKEELSVLGCSTWECSKSFDFLAVSGNYWISTTNSLTEIWVFYNKSVLFFRNYDYTANVRPVISILKSDF